MVIWWFGARWFGYLVSPYEMDCYLGIPRFESQTTGPQTIIWRVANLNSPLATWSLGSWWPLTWRLKRWSYLQYNWWCICRWESETNWTKGWLACRCLSKNSESRSFVPINLGELQANSWNEDEHKFQFFLMLLCWANEHGNWRVFSTIPWANMSEIQNGIMGSWRSYACSQLNFKCYVATWLQTNMTGISSIMTRFWLLNSRNWRRKEASATYCWWRFNSCRLRCKRSSQIWHFYPCHEYWLHHLQNWILGNIFSLLL